MTLALTEFVFQDVFSKREPSEVGWHFVALQLAILQYQRKKYEKKKHLSR